MPVQDVSCLYSTIRNKSGLTRTFSMLPPHGRKMGNNEELTVFGHIHEAVIEGGDRIAAARQMAAFEAAIESGYLEIIKTPNPIFLDDDDNVVKMLILRNGALVLTDPCWTSLSA